MRLHLGLLILATQLGVVAHLTAQHPCQQSRITYPGDPGTVGDDVATNGEWLCIGQPRYDAPSPNSGLAGGGPLDSAGRVQLSRWSGASWISAGVIESPFPEENDLFGSDVELFETTLAVASRGGVHLYEFDGAAWQHDDFLTIPVQSNSVPRAVTLREDEIAFGTSSVGDLTVYSYRRSGNIWIYIGSVQPLADADHPLLVPGGFGGGDSSIALQGGFLFVAAVTSDDGVLMNRGAVYVFEYNPVFGVYLQSDVIVLAGSGENANFGRGLGANSNQLFVSWRSAPLVGAIEVLELVGSEWTSTATISAPRGLENGLALRGIETRGESEIIVSTATRSPLFVSDSSRVLRYVRDASTGSWDVDELFEAEMSVQFDFQMTIDVSGNVLAVATGSSTSLPDIAVTIYRLPTTLTENLGGEVAGEGGFVPTLTTSECAAIDHSFAFELSNGKGGALGGIVISLGPVLGLPSANGGILFPRAPWIVEMVHVLDGSGAGNGTKTMELGLLPPFGVTYVAQCLYLDSSVSAGWSQSNAVRLVVDGITGQ